VEETQTLILRSLRWVVLGMLALSLAGGVLFARSALHRVERINRAVHAIMLGDLGRRVPVGRTDDELNRLAANINAMLDRIGELMESLRQVTNDIAHDLRTPLGRLRQRLDTARMRETDADSRQVLDDAVAQIGEILETFNALLRIAQIEAGARKASFASVDLSDVATTIAEAYDSVAEAEGRTLRADVAAGIQLDGDRDLLTQMLANLVENAIRHTPPGSHIELALHRAPGAVVISVADDGPGIPPEERVKVLDRFYRLEASRTTPGSGLGLALIKAIADLHDAALVLRDTTSGSDPRGLTVEVRLPAKAGENS
jgi:signal transduction histidine kinase